MKSSKVTLIWKRSDPWAKKLGAPREIIVGEFWSDQEAHEAIPSARAKLIKECTSEIEREEITHGSWWTQDSQKLTG